MTDSTVPTPATRYAVIHAALLETAIELDSSSTYAELYVEMELLHRDLKRRFSTTCNLSVITVGNWHFPTVIAQTMQEARMTAFRSSPLITRATPLSFVILNKPGTRDFFKSECGESFKLNREVKNWIADNSRLTCGDLIDRWMELKSANSAGDRIPL